MARPGRRTRDEGGPIHRAKRARPHVADEYAELGDLRTAAELRRHLRGHSRDLQQYERDAYDDVARRG